MTALKEWLKKSWMWIVGAFGVLIGILTLRKLLQKKEVAVQPGPSKVQQDEDKKYEAEKESALEVKEVKTLQAQNAHEKEVKAHTDSIERATDRALEDPDVANAYIQDIGDLMRDD